MLATQQEIDDAVKARAAAEAELTYTTLRLRALRGQSMMQTGDSFSAPDLQTSLEKLEKEFGTRNLRMY